MTFSHPDRWSADNLEFLESSDSFGKVFKLSNVKYFDKDNSTTVHYPGKTFIAFAEAYIWHYLYDNLAQFEYLKTQVSDLKMVMFCPTSSEGGTIQEFLEDMKYLNFHNRSNEKTEIETHKYLEDTFNIFVNQENISNLYKNNMTFEEVYFVRDQQSLFVDTLSKNMIKFWFGVPYAYWIKPNYEANAHMTRDIFDETWWRQIGLMKMRQKLLLELNKNNIKTPEKIFISRKDANLRYQKSINPAIVKIHDRMVNVEVDSMIEDFFVSRGYHPLTLEGMSYLEQTKYFQNAKSIAGIIGSGFCQTLVCNPNAVVTEIMLNKRYNFTYKFISSEVGFNLNQIDLRKISEDKEKISMVLEKKYQYIESLLKIKDDEYK